ncbi:MAG: hypothetical protein H6587_11855 [Flavobacteriales bacterium]|jgi:hypothetical protein|nr:hypothetical protein [Flavobacteriales bacterium]MCB9365257.1 hypothetical protein [Flavobacteriales bacterium]
METIKNIFIIFFLSFLIITLSGCKQWIEFDILRIKFGFIFTLVMALIFGLIALIKGGGKNK